MTNVAIFRAIISIIAIILTTFIIPYVKQKIDEIKDEKLKSIIEDAVWAAQQTLTDNTEKKEFVLRLASEWLKNHKINISATELDILIESAVLNMKVETK